MNSEESLREALIPSESVFPNDLDLRIHKAVRRGVRGKRVRRAVRVTCSMLACLIAIIGIAAVSPQVARAFSQVPVLSTVIELVRNDPGLILAINHEYIQRVDQIQVAGETRVTLQYIMADDHGMVLFTSREGPTDFWLIESVVADGQTMHNWGGFGTGDGSMNVLEISFNDGWTVPEHIDLTLSPSFEGDRQQKMTFSFDVDRSILCPPKIYDLDVDGYIGGGVSIQQARLEIYPTVAMLNITAQDQGTEYLYAVDYATLTTDRGDVFAGSGMMATVNQVTAYLQSPYFTKSGEFELDMGKALLQRYEPGTIVMDLVNNTVTGIPEGASITGTEPTEQGFILHLYVTGEACEIISGGLTSRYATDNAVNMTSGSTGVADEDPIAYEATYEFEGAMPDRLELEYAIVREVELKTLTVR